MKRIILSLALITALGFSSNANNKNSSNLNNHKESPISTVGLNRMETFTKKITVKVDDKQSIEKIVSKEVQKLKDVWYCECWIVDAHFVNEQIVIEIECVCTKVS